MPLLAHPWLDGAGREGAGGRRRPGTPSPMAPLTPPRRGREPTPRRCVARHGRAATSYARRAAVPSPGQVSSVRRPCRSVGVGAAGRGGVAASSTRYGGAAPQATLQISLQRENEHTEPAVQTDGLPSQSICLHPPAWQEVPGIGQSALDPHGSPLARRADLQKLAWSGVESATQLHGDGQQLPLQQRPVAAPAAVQGGLVAMATHLLSSHLWHVRQVPVWQVPPQPSVAPHALPAQSRVQQVPSKQVWPVPHSPQSR